MTTITRRKPIASVGDELSLIGLMHAPGGEAAPAWIPDEQSYGIDFSQGGFSIGGGLPEAEVFGLWERQLMRRVVELSQTLRPPRTVMEAAIYGTMEALATRRKRVSPQALVLGLALAAAQAQRVRIKTHARDLAKQAEVRYATLLLVRKLAVAQFERWATFRDCELSEGEMTGNPNPAWTG